VRAPWPHSGSETGRDTIHVVEVVEGIHIEGEIHHLNKSKTKLVPVPDEGQGRGKIGEERAAFGPSCLLTR